jgi:hypothetical protein
VPDRSVDQEEPGGLVTGPGRVLVAVYAVFAISSSARASYQIATGFSDAPVPYLLSALAAAVYVVATVALARTGATARRVALTAVLFELAGVLAVGTVSSLVPEEFPEATVWSSFGRGYGFVPLVLPLLGLWWLLRGREPRNG